MKHFKLIKKLDLFSLPVNTFYTSRDKKVNKKTYHLYHGSLAGGFLTLMFAIIIFGNFLNLTVKMFKGDADFHKVDLELNEMKTIEDS